MFDYISRMNELIARRFCCSQVLVALALEMKGCENPDVNRELIRAVNGLCGGMGGRGMDCGALTGAACVIGLFCGWGEIGEQPHDRLHRMVSELVEWFEDEYGSVECSEILNGEPQRRMELCPEIMRGAFENAVRIMLENDVEIG